MSGADAIRQVTEGGLPAPREISSLRPALQVAVGVDVKIGEGWDFRFAFSETISANPISKELTPFAPRNLAACEIAEELVGVAQHQLGRGLPVPPGNA